MLGGLEDRILTPENVDYIVEQAVNLIRNDTSANRAERDEERLRDLEHEINNLIDLAAVQGSSERIALGIDDREQEAAQIKTRLSRRPAPLDIGAIQSAIRDTVSDLGSMLRSSPEDARKALGALFGQNRLRVQPDPERGFVVRGDALLCCGGAGDRTRTCTQGTSAL